MRWTFSFLAMFIIAALWPNVVDSFDYCTIPCGKDNKHTMCRWPPDIVDFSGNCKNSKVRIGMSKELKKALLHYHNLARSTLAQGLSLGKVSGLGTDAPIQPKASNMMPLKWSNEAATIAQRWANQCQFGHDSCHTLSDNTFLGQNAFASTGIPDDRTTLGESAVRAWMSEVKYLNDATFVKGLLEKFVFDENTGHYTQVVWAETTHIGCSKIEYVIEGGNKGLYLICNYAPSGNKAGARMYLVGKPCSECPNGGECSTEYPGLCLASEGGKDDSIEEDNILEFTESDQKNKQGQKQEQTQGQASGNDVTKDDTGNDEDETSTTKHDERSENLPFNDDSAKDSAFSFKLCVGCMVLVVSFLWFCFV